MLRKQATQGIRRALVGNCDFTIVSNDCWGAHVYEDLGIPYKTPFVGLFIPPESYLNLLENLHGLMGSSLVFTQESLYPMYNAMRWRQKLRYPIATLGGSVELHFLHYKTRAEAEKKWHRRRLRMVQSPDRYFFKFDDRDGASKENIERFCSMPLKNKVCFTTKPMNLPTILAPEQPGPGEIMNGRLLGRKSRRYFNTLRWISSRPSYLPLPSLL